MSRIVLEEDGLLVADRVLSDNDFRIVAKEVVGRNYRGVHVESWDKAWRLWDGQPLRGDSVYFDPNGAFRLKGAKYPTSTPLDLIVDAVRRAAASRTDIAGVEGVDWVALYLAPWLYPVGSALARHHDTGKYSGSFTFFAHARWSAHWGGDLVVSRPRPPDASMYSGESDDAWISDDGAAATDSGLAIAVSPHPNRLVLLGENRPHRIARIDSNAGAHVRTSVAGFFLRAP